MADRKIDLQKAKSWLNDVNDEIDKVEKLLDEVSDVCADFPNKDDSFVKLIEGTGSFLKNAWKKTSSTFKNAWGKVDEILKEIEKAGKNNEERIKQYEKKSGK